MKTTKPQQLITLYGNLGADPESRSFPAKTITKQVYDPITDGPVERLITLDEVNFRTFSVACGGYDDKPLRWINCVDWEGCAFRARKGDNVKLVGYFEDRTYTKDGEQKTTRQFVVEGCEIKRMKIREAVA